MSQLELLRVVLEALGRLGIGHMLVGSYASSFHGESRSTHDIDLVIDLDPAKIRELVQSFDPERYYLSESALREGRMANVIDTMTGDKVDLFILADDADSRLAFDRRQTEKIFGMTTDIATAEDVILAKLRWDARLGGSQQQRSDVLSILRNGQKKLDFDYLMAHAGSGVPLLKQLVSSAESE